VLLLASRDPVDFVTSTDLERNRLAGPLLRRLGCVFVQRDRADRSVEEVAESVRLVDGGHRLVVFPEGSITRAPGLRAFRLGAFTIAAAAGCPVVPVGIRGTRDIVRPGTYLPRRGAVEVVVGVPILATGDDFAAHVDLAERARRAVGELSREPQISWEPPPATPASR
jgi:1-acyl-sn-glycerol-3-phosphate acyltransferase